MSRSTLAFAAAVAAAIGLAAANVQAAPYTKTFDASATTPAPNPTSAAGGAWAIGGTSNGNVLKGFGSSGGVQHWRVVDQNLKNTSAGDGSAENNSVNYAVSATSSSTGDAGDFYNAINYASNQPWSFTITLRVEQSGNPTLSQPNYNAPTVVDLRNGRRIYDLAFVNDGVNNGLYSLKTGTTFAIDGSDGTTTKIGDLNVGEFNTIRMIYTPNAADHTLDVVDVYLNGSTTSAYTMTDANTNASGTFRALVGSNFSAATSTVAYRQFSFDNVDVSVPEPAALAGLAGLGLVTARRRRQG